MRLRSLRVKSLALTIGGLTAPILLLSLVYGVREHVLSTALLLLPVGVLIAWWMGMRMVRPLESLRQEVLERAQAAVPRAGLSLGRRDEFGDLSDAFDSLLRALEKRSKATEAFVADVAHELKNPITAIRSAAEQLETKEPRLAQVIAASCRRLDQRVSELLELARAEAGLPDDVREKIDVVVLVRALGDEKIALTAPATLVVDAAPLRLESALRNLLDNARSFGASVRVQVAENDKGCTITIVDDGPGINAEDLPRVFDRFFTTRHDAGGTGIGLALTRAIIEAHGGSISVDSTPGNGATFTLFIPFSHPLH